MSYLEKEFGYLLEPPVNENKKSTLTVRNSKAPVKSEGVAQ